MEIVGNVGRSLVSEVAPIDEHPPRPVGETVVGEEPFVGGQIPLRGRIERFEQRAIARQLVKVYAGCDPLRRIGRDVNHRAGRQPRHQAVVARTLGALHQCPPQQPQVSIRRGRDVHPHRDRVARPLPALAGGVVHEGVFAARAIGLDADRPDSIQQGIAAGERAFGRAVVATLEVGLLGEPDPLGVGQDVQFEEAPSLGCQRRELLRAAAGDIVVQVAGRAGRQRDVRRDAIVTERFGISELDDRPFREVEEEPGPTQPHAPQIVTSPETLGRQLVTRQISEEEAGRHVVELGTEGLRE